MKVEAYNKSQIAKMYKVSNETIKKWLSEIPDLCLREGQRILTPKQVEKVFAHLGNPD
jgi:transposase